MIKFTRLVLLSFLLLSPRAFAYAPDINCLAATMFKESGGEIVKGQQATGVITINRAHRRFHGNPGSICKALYQKGQYQWTKRGTPKVSPQWIDKANRLYSSYFINNIIPSGLEPLRKVEYFARPGFYPVGKSGRIVMTIGNHNFWKPR